MPRSSAAQFSSSSPSGSFSSVATAISRSNPWLWAAVVYQGQPGRMKLRSVGNDEFIARSAGKSVDEGKQRQEQGEHRSAHQHANHANGDRLNESSRPRQTCSSTLGVAVTDFSQQANPRGRSERGAEGER